MKPLCPAGFELQEFAIQADMIFKSALLHFFSNAKRDDDEKLQIEQLGIEQREADDAFNRHRRLCMECTEAILRTEKPDRRAAIR